MTEGLTDLAQHKMVLATDLDGTFLGGSDADRDTLYSWIEARRETVGLVFVTGRDPAFIADLCAEGWVPQPDYVIGDVGTTIAHVAKDGAIEPLTPLEADIADIWADRGTTLRDKLDGHAGLSLQDTAFRYRLSYDMDPDRFDASAKAIVEDHGADALISDNRFFDVLPRGISKGPSLVKLVDHLRIDRARVLAAGDTLNDLSMLVSGLPAVAVGGSEQPLLDALPPAPNIHRATRVGAAGILEAIGVFDLHPQIH
ncbi:MAG: HAD-IIB family hydrolase, partial [Pseudomonadota bacterium]